MQCCCCGQLRFNWLLSPTTMSIRAQAAFVWARVLTKLARARHWRDSCRMWEWRCRGACCLSWAHHNWKYFMTTQCQGPGQNKPSGTLRRILSDVFDVGCFEKSRRAFFIFNCFYRFFIVLGVPQTLQNNIRAKNHLEI